MERSQFTGLVLAGGRSRRMGADKATLELAGERLVDRAVRIASQVFAQIVVVRGAPGLDPIQGLSVPQTPDLRPDNGALGGLHAGLHAAATPAVVVLPCDLPLIDPSFLALLADGLGDADGLVPRDRHGWQPVVAAYHRRCLPAIEACLDVRERRVFAFYPECDVRPLELADQMLVREHAEMFLNVNRPRDLQKVKELLGLDEGFDE